MHRTVANHNVVWAFWKSDSHSLHSSGERIRGAFPVLPRRLLATLGADPAGKRSFASRALLELLFQLPGLRLECRRSRREHGGSATTYHALLWVAGRLRRFLPQFVGLLSKPARLLIDRSPLSAPVGLRVVKALLGG
jgi:hypothetical protein